MAVNLRFSCFMLTSETFLITDYSFIARLIIIILLYFSIICVAVIKPFIYYLVQTVLAFCFVCKNAKNTE